MAGTSRHPHKRPESFQVDKPQYQYRGTGTHVFSASETNPPAMPRSNRTPGNCPLNNRYPNNPDSVLRVSLYTMASFYPFAKES
jgi:hypothetical protein